MHHYSTEKADRIMSPTIDSIFLRQQEEQAEKKREILHQVVLEINIFGLLYLAILLLQFIPG